MNIQTITLEYLKANGFDGLYNPGLCACKRDDLMPCDQPSIDECHPGYLQPQEQAEYGEGEADCEFYIGKNKPEGTA